MIWFNAETNVHVFEVDFGNMRGCRFFITKFIRFLNRMLPIYAIKRIKRGDILPFYLSKLGMLNPFYWCPRYISTIQKEEREFELHEYEITDEFNVKSKICELNRVLIFRNKSFMVVYPKDIHPSDKKVVIFADNKMLKLGRRSSPPFVRKGYNYFRSIVDTHIMRDKERQTVAKVLYNKRILMNNNEESGDMNIIDRYRFRYIKKGYKKETEKDVYLIDIKKIEIVEKRKRYVKAEFDSEQLFFYNESVYPRTFHDLLAENKELFKDYKYEKFDKTFGMTVPERKNKWQGIRKFRTRMKFLQDKFFQTPDRFNKENMKFEVYEGDEEGNIKKNTDR